MFYIYISLSLSPISFSLGTSEKAPPSSPSGGFAKRKTCSGATTLAYSLAVSKESTAAKGWEDKSRSVRMKINLRGWMRLDEDMGGRLRERVQFDSSEFSSDLVMFQHARAQSMVLLHKVTPWTLVTKRRSEARGFLRQPGLHLSLGPHPPQRIPVEALKDVAAGQEIAQARLLEELVHLSTLEATEDERRPPRVG